MLSRRKTWLPWRQRFKRRASAEFDDARPDRWGERLIKRFEKSQRLSLLEYLLFTGDDRYGALGVSIRADAYVPWSRAPLANLADLDEMAQVVRKVLANEPVPEIQRRLIRPGVSLGGARPKSLIAIDGEPWLVKSAGVTPIDIEMLAQYIDGRHLGGERAAALSAG